MPEWSNWSRGVSCAPRAVCEPQDDAELAALVRRAAADGVGVRVVGSGHSFTPLVATGGYLVSLDAMQGIESVDAASQTAWIRAGTKLYALGEPLERVGLALANMGDIDRQSLAGAVSTGTHGTGRTLGSLSSRVRSLRVVRADGATEVWDAASDPPVTAAEVAFGVLGILTSIELELIASYRLHERVWWTWTAACLERLDELVASNRHFEFFWYPRPDACELKTLNPTTAPDREDVAPAFGGERCGASWRILPSERNARFNEMEYAVPAADGPECFRRVMRRMRERHPDVLWPVEYRTVAADDAWLSPAYRRDVVTISIHQAARLPYGEFFGDIEPIFAEFGGRPHWGKIHGLGARELAELYPRWGEFCSLRARLDPGGVFLNDYLRPLFGG